ncbi:hypothetical protein GCM10027569_83380 [Flindersiella endophytica]
MNVGLQGERESRHPNKARPVHVNAEPETAGAGVLEPRQVSDPAETVPCKPLSRVGRTSEGHLVRTRDAVPAGQPGYSGDDDCPVLARDTTAAAAAALAVRG